MNRSTQNSPICQIRFLIIPWTVLHLTSLSSGPSSSLYYFSHFKNPGLIHSLVNYKTASRSHWQKKTPWPLPIKILSET